MKYSDMCKLLWNILATHNVCTYKYNYTCMWKWKSLSRVRHMHIHMWKCYSLSCVQLSETHRLEPTKLLYPWDFSGNTEEGCHFLLQGIFPAQGLNLCLLHWQVDSLQLSHLGSPKARITDDKTENIALNQANHWGPIKTLNSGKLPWLAVFVFIVIH